MSSLISVDSGKSLAQIREDLPRACAAQKFGVLGVQDLQQKLREKGLEFERGVLVFDVCNPQQAKRVLDAHTEVATVLPCRIAAFELPETGKTRLATVRPTELIGLFGARSSRGSASGSEAGRGEAADLEAAACEVERALRAILEEAARG